MDLFFQFFNTSTIIKTLFSTPWEQCELNIIIIFYIFNYYQWFNQVSEVNNLQTPLIHKIR